MPHSTRRSRHERTAAAARSQPAPNNNNNSSNKRNQVALDDGWTLVRGARRRSTAMPRRLSPAELAATHTPHGRARAMPGTGREKLLERYEKFKERWTESACREDIRSLLVAAAAAAAVAATPTTPTTTRKTMTVTSAVCLGLGSPSVDNAAAGVRSMWQLVCFLDIVAMLAAGDGWKGQEREGEGEEEKVEEKEEEKGDGEKASSQQLAITLYAEDPVFNELDEEVLGRLGIEIVHGRKGAHYEGAAKYIEKDSFVFAPFMPSFMVLEDYLADKDPALYVGNDVQATLELARSQVRFSGDVDERTRRCIRVAEEFLAQGREKAKMPDFELHEHALAGQMIYWRRPAEDE